MKIIHVTDKYKSSVQRMLPFIRYSLINKNIFKHLKRIESQNNLHRKKSCTTWDVWNH